MLFQQKASELYDPTYLLVINSIINPLDLKVTKFYLNKLMIDSKIMTNNAGMAQMVAQLIRNQ